MDSCYFRDAIDSYPVTTEFWIGGTSPKAHHNMIADAELDAAANGKSTLLCHVSSSGMNGVLGHDSALYDYTGPGTTWANKINFVMLSMARPVD